MQITFSAESKLLFFFAILRQPEFHRSLLFHQFNIFDTIRDANVIFDRRTSSKSHFMSLQQATQASKRVLFKSCNFHACTVFFVRQRVHTHVVPGGRCPEDRGMARWERARANAMPRRGMRRILSVFPPYGGSEYGRLYPIL